MMHKALSFYAIYNRSGYDKKCEIYLEEAKRVISFVKIDDSTQSSTKAFYNMYYGQIYADIDKLKEALSFYEAVGSIDNIIKACDHILVAAVRNNDNKEGLDIIPKYLQYKGMLPDCAKKRSDIQQILELEKILKCNIQNQQT
jgi:hypothetical protein